MSRPSDRQLFLAFIRLHILHHAAREPVFGLGLILELRRHGYELSPGTIYPALHGLENDGCLRSELAQINGRWRRVYRATRRGVSLLEEGRRRALELLAEIGSPPRA